MAARPARPGRTLIVFFLGVAILYGLVALGGTWKPALGLDLQGGTRITLVATGEPDAEAMEEARKIIDARVNGSGVSEAEVTTQGDRFIVVEIPGENRSDLVDVVTRTAQLRFRTVACSSLNPGPCATSTPPGEGVPVDPSAEPSDEPSAKPGDEKSDKPADDASATPRNRPAFGLADEKNDKKNDEPSESPSASVSDSAAPSESPTAEPAKDGDKAKQALSFMLKPDQASIDAFNAYTCPNTEAVVDDPDLPLVTCGAGELADVKWLLSPVAVEGTDLTDASAGVPAGQFAWQVNLSLGGDGEQVFEDLSRAMVGTQQEFAVVLDGKVISHPGFEGVISDGQAQISGGFTEESATNLATSLKFGALPVDFEDDVTSEEVGPSLAGNQLQAGLTAALLGLILVMAYCLVYYRGLGLVVLFSLVMAAAITYAMVLLLAKTAGFTLTLPGIAGLVIGVGITADSFIIFFERIRDEMREGKSMRVAVETGWRRARKTRLAANVVSLLSATVLYLFATGVVKGFGFALGLSTVIDLAILFWFTKPLVSTLARFKFFNGGGELSGLSAKTLGVDSVPVSVPAGGKA